MEILFWLENWYKSKCDGYWEHLYGVKIDTLDNPGWSIHIDLFDTDLAEREFNKLSYENDGDDWIICYKENKMFIGWGGPSKLEEILTIFKKWVEGED